ncbi:MFS transporter [Weissella paramesenteroides]|jgi:EmrB/QacA subfamily drug resistance transporter|uniref:Multidrug efflux MFS transporter n=4 Tax=Weissella paramesenteroides TaxID=1249 RepID=A0ABD4XKK9_WEIPA|nr:MFS transporter [Weissella paramesenteroides]KAA8455451.1 multidrug efflux MFS transporter [Weissella paramesenteroides]KAA8459447.1 multidrug efflux MFS transporter [Weissella paramesenteroides]KAA8459544.1 multidrug efflux MFS transporter [Weissella paramesenteroides]KAA8460745.1 multidrug efflux MFS transporter [Weissella paramesenteroides]KAA8460988.1 multidrug efflux MFS transporter [Weissella paramesenteroides]
MNEEKVSSRVIWSIVAAAILGFSGILTETSMNVTFPELIQQFHQSMGTVQWLTTAYLLVVALMMLTSAHFNAILSKRQTYMIGWIAFVVGDIIAIIAPSFWLLLFGRLIMAVGTGFALPLVFNVIFTSVPMSQLGKYMGFGTLIISLAPALGPVYGGVVTYTLGWRAIFMIILPVTIVSLLIGWFNLDNQKPASNNKFAYGQFILIGISLVSAILALGQLESGRLTATIVILALVAVVAMIGFIQSAKRSTNQLIDISVFRSKALVMALLIYATSQAINLAVNFALPQYSQLTLGTTTMVAGFILMPGSLLGSAVAPVYGSMYDRLGANKPLTWGSLGFLVVMIIFSVMAPNIATIGLTIVYAVFTLARNLTFSVAMTAGVAEVKLQQSGDVNAIFNTVQQFIGAVGTTVAALFIQTSGTTKAAIATQTATGFSHLIWFSTVIVAISLIWLVIYMKTKTAK